MEIRYQFDGALRQSVAWYGQKQVGFCRFDVQDQTWTIYTTQVLDEYGGQGIAKQLVLKVEQEAKQQGVNLRSTCGYATKILGL